MPVRVFHGDDSEAYRLLIRETLPAHGDIEVVGGAATVDDVIAGVERERPDVVLLDQMGGSAVIERLRAAVPGVRIVILSGYEPGHGGDEELERGADAYVVKTAHPTVLAAAVRGG